MKETTLQVERIALDMLRRKRVAEAMRLAAAVIARQADVIQHGEQGFYPSLDDAIDYATALTKPMERYSKKMTQEAERYAKNAQQG